MSCCYSPPYSLKTWFPEPGARLYQPLTIVLSPPYAVWGLQLHDNHAWIFFNDYWELELCSSCLYSKASYQISHFLWSGTVLSSKNIFGSLLSKHYASQAVMAHTLRPSTHEAERGQWISVS